MIKNSKLVVWNGPMGVFEIEPFSHGTRAVAQACADTEGYTVIGGGDSAAAAEKFNLADKWTISPQAAALRLSSWKAKHSRRSSIER